LIDERVVRIVVSSSTISQHRMIYFLIAFELTAAVVGLALAWLFGVPVLERLDWDTRSFAVGVAATVPLLIALAIGLRWLPAPLRHLYHRLDEEVLPMLAPASWPQLILMAVAAGVGEEILFRGFLQQAFADRFGIPAGVIIASVLFGLAHPMSKTYILLAGVMGAWFGVLFVETDGLLAPIVTHALYDFIALVWLLRRYRLRIETIGDDEAGGSTT
jgi:membrane protease YdiL (CAAX protease family)